MDVSLITLIIGYIGLFSSIEAQFPFQTGPILYDPYASFFGSEELNPFASNELQMSVPTHHHHHHNHSPKRPVLDQHRNRILSGKFLNMNDHRDYHKNVYEVEPSKWRKYSRTTYTRPPKSNFKQMSVPVPKFSGNNKELIRPRPQSNADSIEKHISKHIQTNLNSKPLINYKSSSNSFRDSVPRFRENHSSNKGSEKRTDKDSNDEPSSLDIEMNGDEDNEEHYHNRHQNRDRSKVQFSSPPNHSPSFKPHNYAIREKAYSFDKGRHNRPALYEIEPPKNLDKNRPSHGGPSFIQKINVPHQTLMEIADMSGPPRPPTSRRPHPFEGFHQPQPKFKPESEIIVNALDDGLIRQVGASMSVQLEDRKFQPRGKIFDEPIAGSERRQIGNPYQHKPFRPNEGNPFNSKLFDSFTKNENNNYNNDFKAVENLKRNENPFPYVESKSDDYDDDSSSNSDNQEYNDNNDDSPKSTNNYYKEESTQRPQMRPFTGHSSQRPQQHLQQSEARDSDEDDESSQEWSSNGIPGQPGKDYPMLSNPAINSAFSCNGRPYGFYADVTQKCQVYHQCSAQGSQKFLCPNGTLFNQESLVCEWWYNVLCENSEQLYHKNALLYRNDGPKQSDDISNDENSQRRNEYNKSWKSQNHNNIRNNNNNLNGYHNHNNVNNNNYHNNNHNHNPHNHYSNNNFRANSDRNNERHSRAPDPEYDDEVDVDLSNDESRNNLIKVLSTHQIVSKLNAFNNNKTKNIKFRP